MSEIKDTKDHVRVERITFDLNLTKNGFSLNNIVSEIQNEWFVTSSLMIYSPVITYGRYMATHPCINFYTTQTLRS